MGAMIASMLLQPLTEDTEQKIANIKTKLLMRVGMGPRKAFFRQSLRRLWRYPWERAKGRYGEGRGDLTPVKTGSSNRHSLDPAPRMTVDIDQDGVERRSLQRGVESAAEAGRTAGGNWLISMILACRRWFSSAKAANGTV
jgi:hypothetical protein